MAKKKTTKKTSVDKKVAAGAAVTAGIIAASAIGYVMFGPEGKKNRKKMKSWMMDAKSDIAEKAQRMKTVTVTEFGEVIDDVLGEYKAMKKITTTEAALLKKDLQKNWTQIAGHMIAGDYAKVQDTVGESFKKRAKKVTKKIKKEVTGTATKAKKSTKKVAKKAKKTIINKKVATKKATPKKKTTKKK